MQLLCVCLCGLFLLPQFGPGTEGLCFDCGARGCGGREVNVSPVRCYLEPHQVLLWAWHGVKSEAIAVNEAECITGVVWKVRREERLQKCEVGITVGRWCCPIHT